MDATSGATDGVDFVQHGMFHHVLKFFDPEELLKLRVVNSHLKERVTDELFKTQDIYLHESTFETELASNIQNTKNLRIEGLQLRDETDTLFNGLTDGLFEGLESLSLAFTTDADTHGSIETIMNKLKHPTNLLTLKITVWESSHIGRLFEVLADNDLPLYKSVTNLEIITHNYLQGSEKITDFIGRFESLERLQATPNAEFNPFPKLVENNRVIQKLCIWTPDTQENCDIVSEFVNNSHVQELELQYIQFENRTYNFNRIASLKNLIVQNLSNVDISSLLSQNIDSLEELHLNDVGLTGEQYDALLTDLDKCPNLTKIKIQNTNFDHETKVIDLASKVSMTNKFSLQEFNIAKNKLTKETLDAVLTHLKDIQSLRLIDLTCIKNIHEWKLEDLVDSLKKLESTVRDKHVQVNFSEHYFEYFCRDHKRVDAMKMINEAMRDIKVYFHPLQTEEKPKDE